MDATSVTFLGGLVLGLASTLHCSAMCGGISCSALLMLGPKSAAERLQHTVLLQIGRLISYAALGAAGAMIGAAILSPNAAMSFRTMQWIAAVVLMWTGLAMAGLMPRIAVLDGAMVRVSDAVAHMTRPLRGTAAGPLVLGSLWGLNPCPMVYGAVFTASLTGSPVQGVIVMSGFALGTMPGIVASGYGLSAITALKSRPLVQGAAGLGIAVAGFASLYIPAAYNLPFCLTN